MAEHVHNRLSQQNAIRLHMQIGGRSADQLATLGLRQRHHHRAQLIQHLA